MDGSYLSRLIADYLLQVQKVIALAKLAIHAKDVQAVLADNSKPGGEASATHNGRHTNLSFGADLASLKTAAAELGVSKAPSRWYKGAY
jgi:hypothetical protein